MTSRSVTLGNRDRKRSEFLEDKIISHWSELQICPLVGPHNGWWQTRASRKWLWAYKDSIYMSVKVHKHFNNLPYNFTDSFFKESLETLQLLSRIPWRRNTHVHNTPPKHPKLQVRATMHSPRRHQLSSMTSIHSPVLHRVSRVQREVHPVRQEGKLN